MEYVKVKARVTCWHEEILLIVEEMRRMVTFLQWKSHWWRNLMAEHHICIDIQRGSLAYSCHQEAQLLDLGRKFAVLWCPTLVASCFDIS